MQTKLEELLNKGEQFILNITQEDFMKRPAKNKWSKKEILGHLIDSAINNLQRFTEIQFSEKPYLIRSYKQNDLVLANDYQNAESPILLQFWLAINRHILQLIKNQTKVSLAFTILLNSKTESNLKYLITDYVDHLEHHLNQILNKP